MRPCMLLLVFALVPAVTHAQANQVLSSDPTYYGCYTDDLNNRALDVFAGYRADMTPEVCRSLCTSYEYAGVQYSGECWCGDGPGYVPRPDNECEYPCSGDPSQTCGGFFRNSIYNVEEPAPAPLPPYHGCFVDDFERALPVAAGYRKDMTPNLCAALCGDFTYAGVQYSGECWCGNGFLTDQLRPDSECDYPCTGAGDAMCGGFFRNSIYGVPSYLGCFTDNLHTRALPVFAGYRKDMTPNLCVAMCGDFTYAGVQYSGECWCGNTVGHQLRPEGECNQPCTGNGGPGCGGYFRASIYRTGCLGAWCDF